MTQFLSFRNQNLRLGTLSTKWSSGPTLNRPSLGRRRGVLRVSRTPVQMDHCLPPIWASSGPRQEHLTKHPRTRAEQSPGIGRCIQIASNFGDQALKTPRADPGSPTTHTLSPSGPPRACACAHGARSDAPPLTHLGVRGLATQAGPAPASVWQRSAAGRAPRGNPLP